MMETIIYCDRCKARIDADRTWLENRCGPFVDGRRAIRRNARFDSDRNQKTTKKNDDAT
jgi:hypothetical protein